MVAVNDAIRFVIITLAAVTGAAMPAVAVLHVRAWRVERPVAKLLPLHIALICVGYILVTVLLALSMLDGLGQRMSWRVPGYGVVLLVGLGVLWLIGRRRYRRIHAAPQ